MGLNNTVSDVYTKQFTSKDGKSFVMSTDISLADLETLNQALASSRMHWARSMSISELQTMLSNSLFFGVYESATDPDIGAMVGFARLVTDRTTFAYLTDVWVSENATGHGLGTWLIGCVDEWISMIPHLRQFWLLTSESKTAFYKRKLGMGRMEDLARSETVAMVRKGAAGVL